MFPQDLPVMKESSGKIFGFLNREEEGFDPFTCMFNDQSLPMCEEGGHYILTRQTPPYEVDYFLVD